MADSSTGSIFDFETPDEVLNLPAWPESNEGGPRPSKAPRTLAPNLTRRTHRKSRGGCFNCKSRKIKCQETRPSCEHCQFKQLECRYPSKADQRIVRRPSYIAKPVTSIVKHGEPKIASSLAPSTSFNRDDMRCFHHFLTVAYPHLPLGNESVWVQDIPVLAQQHGYLMHALLALGASHLTRVSPNSDYNTAAIIHRGKAIKGLNEALANTNRGYGESDTMLAACYALTFQASYMGDGMADFITMVRGCALVTQQIKKDHSQTAFNLEDDIHVRLMTSRLENMPQLDSALLTPAIHSTEALRPLLRNTMDHHFHTSLLSVLFALQDSSRSGYLNFIHLYTTFFDMTHDQFNVFLDINNIPAQLLMAHFVSLQMLMIPLVVHEWPRSTDASKAGVLLGNVEWGDRIYERMPPELTGYLQWPKGIMDAVRAEIEALLNGTYRLVRLKILNP